LPGIFDLQNFLPFRLSRLAHEVSQRMASTYSEKFDIDIPQWRVLATLSAKEPCTAQSVVSSTRTHKSTISRAVSSLTETGWIERAPSDEDGRERLLRLTTEGRRKFNELVPVVLAFEHSLYAAMDQESMQNLASGISALENVLEVGTNSAKSKKVVL